ncbi:MAG: hypothetical protein KJ711_04085, partial [Candidatus Omnitrophica bacterium]|nr:hypothetical protein [Candidatus Omnitrophota bacterium]MBU1523474.1 hypothetical protein [Candidatus Omnitrophota bacterium]
GLNVLSSIFPIAYLPTILSDNMPPPLVALVCLLAYILLVFLTGVIPMYYLNKKYGIKNN